MSGALRFFMVALVLVNLAFVSITEAARWLWLAPMVVATACSPLLLRFLRYRLYRAAWNLSLLGVFALLVQHTLSGGVAHMLEDGLMLAALCQVHLLNNLRSEQQPDLLFFNSFLIAVVTSFLSIEVAYFALFLVYAPLLVVGMQLLALSKSGLAMPLRRVVVGGLWRSAAVLGMTMIVFAMWPRDFRRKGLLGEQLRRARAAAASRVDFSDQVLLDRAGEVSASDRVVLRVRGPRAGMPQYWRGATMHQFEGYGWKPSFGVRHSLAERWRQQDDGSWIRVARDREPTYEVLANPGRSQRVFLPPNAVRFRVHPPAHDLRLHTNFDQTVVHARHSKQLRYGVRLRREPRPRGGAVRRRLPTRLRYYAYVRRDLVPPMAVRLAAEVRDRVGRNAPQHVFVEAVRAELSRRYRYLPPGTKGGARALAQFFDGTPGHCEYFATALCVMVRTQGVPCRLVTGYRSDEWRSGTLTVREWDAHAWSEVLDPQGGWYTVDPSPASAALAAARGDGLFARARRWAEGLWAKVTGFDETTRVEMILWLSMLPRRLLWPAAAMLAAGIVLVVLRRRRVPFAIRAYRRALRRHKHELEPGETPRQLATRIPELADATAAHEQARYGYGAR